MANPEIVECPADEWKLVAENVTGGQIKKMEKDPNVYLETYRMTGGTPPTEAAEGLPAFIESNSELISAAVPINVYIMAVKVDGSVRADLP